MLKHALEEIELSSGSSGLLIDIPSTSVFRFEIGFVGGTLHCPEDKREISHSLEHMILKANKTYATKTELSADVSKYGARSNAFTCSNTLSFVYRCPEFDWERIFTIAIKTITTPLLLEKHLKNELKVIEEELTSNLTKYSQVLRFATCKSVFGYDLSDKTRLKLLKNLTIEDLRDFYSQIFNSSNMYFIVMGNLKGKRGLIEKMLNQIQFQTFTSHPSRQLELILPKPQRVKQAVVVSCPEVEKMRFGLHFLKPEIMSYTQCMPAYVLKEILTGVVSIFTSRINKQARDRGLSYGIMSQFQHIYDNASGFLITGTVTDNNADPLFDLIVDELKKIQQGQLTDKEITEAKQKLFGYEDLQEVTTGILMNWYSDYIFYKRLGIDVDEYDQWRSLLELVTVQDVLEYFASMLQNQIWVLGLLGNNVDKHKDNLYAKAETLFQ